MGLRFWKAVASCRWRSLNPCEKCSPRLRMWQTPLVHGVGNRREERVGKRFCPRYPLLIETRGPWVAVNRAALPADLLEKSQSVRSRAWGLYWCQRSPGWPGRAGPRWDAAPGRNL